MIPGRKPTRIPPKMPTQAYKTFAIRSPISTHYRQATCVEVNCQDYQNGWYLQLDGLPEDLLYTATHSGRRFRNGEVEVDGNIVKALIFEAGQACFRATLHVVSLERPEFYFAGRGDYRSFSVRRATQFERPDQFVDTFAEHLDTIRREIQKG